MLRKISVKVFKILGWALIGCAILLTILRCVVPVFTPTQEQLTRWVQTHSIYPVAIKEIKVSMDGFTPKIALYQVDILNENARALHIDQANISLNAFQLLFKNVQIDQLMIDGAQVELAYTQEGKLSVVGLPLYQIDLHQKNDTMDLPRFKGIDLKNSAVTLHYAQKPISLTEIHLWGEGLGNIHLRMDAKIKEMANADLHVRLKMDKAKQEITLYGHGKGENIGALADFLPSLPVTVEKGKWDLQSWVNLNTTEHIQCTTQVELQQSEIKKKEMRFAVDNFQGVWEAEGAGKEWKIKSTIQSKKNTVQADLFAAPITISDFSATGFAHLSSEKIALQANQFQADINQIPVSGTLAADFKKEAKLPYIEMTLHADKAPVSSILALLPRSVMNKQLTTWLDSAILSGNMLGSEMVLRGDLKHFPFDEKNGVFEVITQLENVHLDYDKGWPALTELDAQLKFVNRALTISAPKAKMEDGEVFTTTAHIPDLMASIPQLKIDTHIVSNLENGIKVIQKSPLQPTLGKSLEPIALSGKMDLSLGLDIPLSAESAHEVKVKGNIKVEDAALTVTALDLDINKLQGVVTFTENTVDSDVLSGSFLEAPTQFSLKTQNENQLQIHAQGKVLLSKLEKWITEEHKKEYKNRIHGETAYQADVMIPLDPKNHQMHVQISSDLAGVAIQAPTPLSKDANTAKALAVKIDLDMDKDKKMHIQAQYGADVKMAYALKSPENSWVSLGAQISFGEKSLGGIKEDGILHIDGAMQALKVEEWKAFIDKIYPDASSENKSALQPQLALHLEDIDIYGAAFSKIKVAAHKDSKAQQWHVGLDGPSLKGEVVFSQAKEKPEINIQLQTLVLTKNDEFSVISKNEPSQQHYPITFNIQHLVLDDKNLNEVKGHLEPHAQGYTFPNIQAQMKYSTLQLSGQWDYLSAVPQVSAKGKLVTTNSTYALKALGVKKFLRKAKGSLAFDLLWNGSPAKIDYPSLTGNVHFSLKNGTVHGINPGVGRVLSLLNVDNMQRRLMLDFSDITEKSLAFDAFSGKCQFGKGKLSTNNMLLKGPSVKVRVKGQANLQTQALNGEMTVMPNLTGSLPVAAAIAVGNPAIGAAVWVVDKMIGGKIQEIHRYQYNIAGTMEAPLVQEQQLLHRRAHRS